MTSLSTALSTAEDRRQVPPFPAGDIGALTKVLNLAAPVSLTQNLLPALNNLPYAVVTKSSGPLTANFVHGSAQVGMQSNGNISFRLHVEEDGATGDNFLVTAITDITSAYDGKPIAFMHQGNVAGTLNIGGSTTADWQVDTSDQAIESQWDTAKNSNIQFTLHVSTDPFQLVEGVLGGFFVVALYDVISAADQDSSCTWDGDTDSGQMTQCSDG